MTEEHRVEELHDEAPAGAGAGRQLRAARERAGLTIDQVAQETRIARRYIESLESGDFAALPGRTYAIGFAKSHARVVGLDEVEVAQMVREEMGEQQPAAPARAQVFEPGDPARVPAGRLVVFSLLAVAVLLAGLFFAARQMFAPAAELPSLVSDEVPAARATATEGAAPPTPAPVATPAGPVVFTALEEGIWVKFYTADGVQLMQKLMAQGERYTVPQDLSSQPLLWTGRPDALGITIGGREVPRLAEDDMIMRDVPVTAQALLARGQGAARAAGAGTSPAPAAAPPRT